MPTRPEHVRNRAGPSGPAARTGRVIVQNTWPMSIWYLRAVAKGQDLAGCLDQLDAPILPGCQHALDLPPGLYQLVAETGGGTMFRSPVVKVDPGDVARWEVGGESQ